ncbi:MAG: alpha/beta hydrolase [Solirubrobacterales bacterium]|nr:alpha/beta hydrolase [Solirubrobacterales bacterium]
MSIDEHTIELAGSPVFYRSAPAGETPPPALFVHSLPTSSADFGELLATAGGVAVDLPGFGRSGKGGHLDYSLDGHVAFLERFLEAAGLPRVALVGHGWGGAVSLLLACRRPERVTALTVVAPLPLLPGFAYPAIARWLRRPALGEVLMGSITRRMLARGLRAAAADDAVWPQARVDAVWDQLDQGTQRAILRALRSAGPTDLESASAELEAMRRAVTIVWGEADPWLAPRFADAYAARLPDATVRRVPGAGHWPWLQRPEVAEELARFARDAA